MLSFTPEEVAKRLELFGCDPIKELSNDAMNADTAGDRISANSVLLKYCVPKEQEYSLTTGPTIVHTTRDKL